MPWSDWPWDCCSWAWFMHWTDWCCHAGPVPERAVRTPARAGRRRWRGGAALCAPRGLLLSLPPAGPAAATDTGAAPYGAPATRCEITDPRLPELSGLAGVGEA